MSETLSAERALNLLRLSARVDPLLRQAVADVEVHIEALQAEVTTLRTALEEAAGLFNEMHLPLQGHAATRCNPRTDFCVTAEHVREALHGRE